MIVVLPVGKLCRTAGFVIRQEFAGRLQICRNGTGESG